ncbi:MFS transporter [Rosenbergiella australiborealis]|uniref:MFS transporter n=1 Tax=Rosenbergiella australiborealis TaxID=1544696 RepID=A0ABS5T618_9GAMM|nr:MFS transporter [Rosenbergiella australiborealis]MBT0727792.1 MFS transporter [Rosenbergiella australiborealis]
MRSIPRYRHRATGSWLFPFSLVLFEFTTYIAHDMVQPGMLLVTRDLQVGPEWVPFSLTAYLVGGLVLQWLLGPLSDKWGRRPVLLSGVVLFSLTSGLTFWVTSIEQFMLLRFLQGTSLCFIGAVGYTAVQEAFEERASIRLMAWMANVALLAPLIGPLAGSALLLVTGWRMLFIIFAGLSLIALVGLYWRMPETAGNRTLILTPKRLVGGYWQLLKQPALIAGCLALGLSAVPVLSWVALSPVYLIHDHQLSEMRYALLQLPVFVSMILGNSVLSRLSHHSALTRPLVMGAWPLVSGLLIALLATFSDAHQVALLVTGLSIYAFGAGLSTAVLYRLTLFSVSDAKGQVAAMMGMLSILMYSIGLELAREGYFRHGLFGFSLINLLSGVIWLLLIVLFIKRLALTRGVSMPQS